jgi:HEAT repeat protein
VSLDQRSYFEKLVGALHHPVATARMRAAYILGEIGAKRGIKPLADLIDQAWETQNLFFLREILIALGKIDGDEVMLALVHLLKHPSFLIREAALKALPKGKNNLAVAAVQKALNDPSSNVRDLAREFLEKNSE